MSRQTLFADTGTVTASTGATTYTRPVVLGPASNVSFQWEWTGTPNITNIQLQLSNVADPSPLFTGTVADTNGYWHTVNNTNWTSDPVTISGTLTVANGSRLEIFSDVGATHARLLFTHGAVSGLPVLTGLATVKP